MSILSPSQDTERLVMRKLMPVLVVAYIISFLDRSNIALAKTHLQVDLGLSTVAYGVGAGLFFLTYALAEIPSNLILHRVGARFWITRIMATWGLVSAAMALVQGETSFYVLRLLLGATEAGLFPGVVLYLTYWFGEASRARATGYFLVGVSLANVIGGPLGGALLGLEGKLGLHGWQWMFAVEGLLATAFAAVVFITLPDRPARARWLTPAQRDALERRIADESVAIETKRGKGASGLARCFTDPQILLAILVYFCHQIAIYTVIFFLPGIIAGYGKLSDLQVGCLSALPWLASAIGTMTIPRLANTPARSAWLLRGGLVLMAAGLLIAAWTGPLVAMLGFCLAAFLFFVVQSLIFTYATSRLTGRGLAGGLAFINTCGLLGGFLGPSLMGAVEAHTGSTHDGLIVIAGLLLLSAIAATRLRHGSEERAIPSPDLLKVNR
ncbi:MAG: MFS transporter [Luteibacter sp.]|uniref:MFS transporter n=1 Tax=Luteibacter sp. TaxID=1886636 RepID=UPI0028069512|nr:MFS transporter [Luteibacter sp.]MDQ7995433.1 MFS transporter [Luteibacter sp.]MDQ8048957.1 MFS transporter [Luteibacter sp.]